MLNSDISISAKAKQLSRLGQRAVYGQSLLSLAHDNPSIFAISADLGNSSGLARFASTYPDRFLNIGIAEQHMIGFASGLASCDFNVFCSSFAPFITMRTCEQVRMNLAYMQSNVKIVSIGSGISMGYLGNSHFGLEDISIVRSLPGIPIFCPADCLQLQSILSFLSTYDGPAYVRLSGVAPCKPIYSELPIFKPNSFDDLTTGSDTLILSYGSILSECIDAHNILESQCIQARIINVSCLDTISTELLDIVLQYNHVFVVEEHRITGGLYTLLSQSLQHYCSNNLPQILSVSLPDVFLKSGSYPELLSHYKLDSTSIAEKVISSLD
jgi:transketolase